MSLPPGFHYEEASGGLDRPAAIVENTEEVLARFREKKRPLLRCGYCLSAIQTQSKDEALKWFRQHECDEMAADYGEVWHEEDLAA